MNTTTLPGSRPGGVSHIKRPLGGSPRVSDVPSLKPSRLPKFLRRGQVPSSIIYSSKYEGEKSKDVIALGLAQSFRSNARINVQRHYQEGATSPLSSHNLLLTSYFRQVDYDVDVIESFCAKLSEVAKKNAARPLVWDRTVRGALDMSDNRHVVADLFTNMSPENAIRSIRSMLNVFPVASLSEQLATYVRKSGQDPVVAIQKLSKDFPDIPSFSRAVVLDTLKKGSLDQVVRIVPRSTKLFPLHQIGEEMEHYIFKADVYADEFLGKMIELNPKLPRRVATAVAFFDKKGYLENDDVYRLTKRVNQELRPIFVEQLEKAKALLSR